MRDRDSMIYASCPWCGKILMRVRGMGVAEITCQKCKRVIVALVDNGKITLLENRRAKASNQ